MLFLSLLTQSGLEFEKYQEKYLEDLLVIL